MADRIYCCPDSDVLVNKLDIRDMDGEMVMKNASSQAIRKVQTAFKGAAEAMDVENENDIQALVDEFRQKNGGRLYV